MARGEEGRGQGRGKEEAEDRQGGDLSKAWRRKGGERKDRRNSV